MPRLPSLIAPQVTLALLVFLSACYLSKLTPEAAHQNYLSGLNATIGQDIDQSRYTSLRKELRVSEEILGNGLVRYRYKAGPGLAECRSIYDVDPKTRIVVAVGFEGDIRQCSNPL